MNVVFEIPLVAAIAALVCLGLLILYVHKLQKRNRQGGEDEKEKIEMQPDETTTEEKSSRSYWGFVLWPLAVIVLYVLSAGPVMRAYMNDTVGDGVIVVYSPL